MSCRSARVRKSGCQSTGDEPFILRCDKPEDDRALEQDSGEPAI